MPLSPWWCHLRRWCLISLFSIISLPLLRRFAFYAIYLFTMLLRRLRHAAFSLLMLHCRFSLYAWCLYFRDYFLFRYDIISDAILRRCHFIDYDYFADVISPAIRFSFSCCHLIIYYFDCFSPCWYFRHWYFAGHLPCRCYAITPPDARHDDIAAALASRRYYALISFLHAFGFFIFRWY